MPEPRLTQDSLVLTVNAGSSSLRCAAIDGSSQPHRYFTAHLDRIGQLHAVLKCEGGEQGARDALNPGAVELSLPDDSLDDFVRVMLDQLHPRGLRARLAAIGHRIVHGGERFVEPVRIDAAVITHLRELAPLAPEHLPREIALIEIMAKAFVGLPQVACFDTAFHHQLPTVARLLPVPRRFQRLGVRRYGFHGISYACLLESLGRLDVNAGRSRIVLAHLGNGASMAAVKNGRCIDTTMAMTPCAGLVMSTRSGDLDPGLPGYFARSQAMTAEDFGRMAEMESGMLGVSETSGDVRDLLAAEAHDERAREALDLFCVSAAKWVGAMVVSLEGLDTLVFAGGIGEHAAPLRARICARLAHLGIELDADANAASRSVISKPTGRVTVRVIPTDEESYIARQVFANLKNTV